MNNKELEKKQARQKKVTNLFKWVGLGLIGGLLAFGFFGLLAVGVKGCVNKQQLKQQQEETNTFTPKALKPYDTFVISGGSNTQYNNYGFDGPTWVFLGSSTDNVHHGNNYTWNDGGTISDWVYYPNVNVKFSQSIGTLSVKYAGNVRRLTGIRYIGITNTGMCFSSSVSPSSSNSTTTFYLLEQDMEQGYVDEFVLSTYDYFTLEYLNGSQITITETYYTNGGTEYHWWYRFLNGNNQNPFNVEEQQPTYVNNDTNTELGGVFGLLYQAFSSLASIMNLQVISGLTLGTFIFIPLVVGLIIFIVNLFKR